LAGKWVGEMFQNKKSEDFEYLTYFFTCKVSAEHRCETLRDFFSKNSKDFNYTDLDNGKFYVKLMYSSIENILLTLKICKISNEKFILAIAFNEVNFYNFKGNKTTYFKMMKDFIQDNEKFINLI
jgi:hypothetical protein